MKPYTKEEVLERFMRQVRNTVRYWQTVETDQDRVSGAVFSMLVLLDGQTMGFPAVKLSVDPHPDDKAFHEQQGEQWYEPDQCFNDDVALHELLTDEAT